MPEQIEPVLNEHERRMAEAEAVITAALETTVGKNLVDITTDEFDNVVNPRVSLEGLSTHGKYRKLRVKADKIRANSALLKTRYQKWADDGFPDIDVREFLGVVGLGKAK